MSHARVTVTALMLLFVPFWVRGEVSVIRGPDGKALHLLKITDAGEGFIWEVVTRGDRSASWLNSGGDAEGDGEPVIALTHRRSAETEDGVRAAALSGTGATRALQGITDGAPTSTADRLGIPDVSDFDVEVNLIYGRDTKVASYALPADRDFRLIAVWPARDGQTMRLRWSRWRTEDQRWQPPERVTSFVPLGSETCPALHAPGPGTLELTWCEEAATPTVWRAFWEESGWSAPEPAAPQGLTGEACRCRDRGAR